MDFFNSIKLYILIVWMILAIIESIIAGFEKRAIVKYSIVGRTVLFFGLSEIFVLDIINILVTQFFQLSLIRNLILIVVYFFALCLAVIWNKSRCYIEVFGFDREDAVTLIVNIFTSNGIKFELKPPTERSIISVTDKKVLVKIEDEISLKEKISIKFINFHKLDNFKEIMSEIYNKIEDEVEQKNKVRGLFNFILFSSIIIILFIAYLVR